MKVSFIILLIAFLLNRAYSATDHDDHHHDHDESIDHSHFEQYHDHAIRGLRVDRCGTRAVSKEEMIESNDKVSQWMKDPMHREARMTNVEVSTYIHVITSGSIGDIPEATITSQLSVLNESYKAYGFSFKLIKTTRTNNGGWYSANYDPRKDPAMFNELRVGGSSTLNVYFKLLGGGGLGFATFPSDFVSKPNYDGVVISVETVPGGSIEEYNEGKTLVHEVGHWLGLYHVFAFTQKDLNGKCTGDGDNVTDTPVQLVTYGCPQGKDSCPFDAGLDMVSNFMDYSDDVCLTEFTKGQQDRMLAMWYLYRSTTSAPPTVAPPATKKPSKTPTAKKKAMMKKMRSNEQMVMNKVTKKPSL